MLNTIKDWIWNHPLLYPFALFVLAALVSIYSQDIKRFLHYWPRTNAQMRKSAEANINDRIALLKRLQNDSYQLLLYFGMAFVNTVVAWLEIVAVVFMITTLIPKVYLHLTTVEFMFVGAFVGMSLNVRVVLRQLRNYSTSMADLEQRIASLKPVPQSTS